MRVVTRSDELLMERKNRRGHFRIWVRTEVQLRGVGEATFSPSNFAEGVFLVRESMELFCIGKLTLAIKLEQEPFQDIS